MTSVRTLSILDSTGKVVASNQNQLIGQSFPERDYFRIPQKAPNNSILYVSPPFRTITGGWLIALSRSIVDTNGKFAGVATASLDPTDFCLILNAVRDSPQTWAALAHGDGTLFVWESLSRDIQGLNLSTPESLFTKHIHSGNGTSFFIDEIAANGERSMIAIQTIKPDALHMNTPLVLGLGRNLENHYSEWSVHARYHFLVYFLMVGIGGGVLLTTQQTRHSAILRSETAEAQLIEVSAELASFFNITPSLLCIMNFDGSYRKINPAWNKYMGYSHTDLAGQSFYDFFHPEDRTTVVSAIRELQHGNTIRNLVARFKKIDGSYRHLEWAGAKCNDSLFLAAFDVTARVEEEEQLQAMAFHDQLTGLPNRTLMFDRLNQAISSAGRGGKKTGVLFLDLDGFKAINDTYGHDTGDTVLKTFSHKLVQAVRNVDTVARLGGDEFVIILKDIQTTNDAVIAAEKILEKTRKAIYIDKYKYIHIGASIGISIWPDNGTDINDLLLAADMAMYKSKKNGKNCYSLTQECNLGHDNICFNDTYRTGHEIIDTQHLELTNLASRFCKAVREDWKEEIVKESFSSLMSFTKKHFMTEHNLMVKTEYPDRIFHDEMHRLLILELTQMESEIKRDGKVFLADRLRHWLFEHILSQDIPLANHLKNVNSNIC